MTTDKITPKDVQDFLLETMNLCTKNGIEIERDRIKAEWDKIKFVFTEDSHYNLKCKCSQCVEIRGFEKKVFGK